MNNKLKRMILWVVIFALTWTLVPVQAAALSAPESLVGYEESEVILNPLYEGLVGNLPYPELTQKSDASVLAVASSAYASTYEEAGEVLRDAMLKRQSTIDVYYRTANFDFETDMWGIFDQATIHTGVPKEGDTLGWGWIYLRSSCSYYNSNGYMYVTLTYNFTYHTTAAQEEELDEAVDDLLDELNPTGSDYEKVCTVYDYMCANITYDYANLYDDSYILKFSAYAALVDKTAVCQGYALLFYRLMLELGIDARFIGGTGGGGPHGWNIVQLGKYYYNVDSTWDAGRVGYYSYFLLCEDDFTDGGSDHFRDAEFDTPEFHAAYPMSKTNFDPDTSLIYAPELKVGNVASTGKIKLTWDEVSSAVKYKVYRSTDKENWTLLKTTTGTSLTNTSTEAGTLYYYYVRAIAEDGTRSEKSNIVSRRCDLPQPVVSLSNVASTGKIKISWEAIDGAKKYEVYRSTDNKTWSKLYTTTGTSLTNTSTEAGTLYYYKVRAIASNSGANSAFSTVKSRRCDLPRPVITLSNVASSGKIKITWEPVEGAVKYQVYRSTDNENWSKLYTTTGTSLTNTSTDAGTLYYYKVMAIASNSGANSAFSSVKSRRCDLAQPLLTVTLNDAGKPYLTWEAVDGAVKYRVDRSTDGENWTKLITVTSPRLTHSSAESGITYYYRVYAIASNTAANSAYSEIVSITAG